MRKSNTDPTVTSLRRSGAAGGFLEKYDTLLRQQPEFLKKVARFILAEYFPPDLRDEIALAAQLSLD